MATLVSGRLLFCHSFQNIGGDSKPFALHRARRKLENGTRYETPDTRHLSFFLPRARRGFESSTFYATPETLETFNYLMPRARRGFETTDAMEHQTTQESFGFTRPGSEVGLHISRRSRQRPSILTPQTRRGQNAMRYNILESVGDLVCVLLAATS